MQAVAGQYLGGSVATDETFPGTFRQQIRQERVQVLLGMPDVGSGMQPYRLVATLGRMCDLSVRPQDLFHPLPNVSPRAVLHVGEMVQVGCDVPFVPSIQDRIHVGKVLVQRRPSYPGILGDLRHRHRRQTMAGHQPGNGIENGPFDSASMLFDGLIPQLGHDPILRPVTT